MSYNAKQFIPSLDVLTRKSKDAGRPVLINIISRPKEKMKMKEDYRIPKTPRTSGIGWGY